MMRINKQVFKEYKFSDKVRAIAYVIFMNIGWTGLASKVSPDFIVCHF